VPPVYTGNRYWTQGASERIDEQSGGFTIDVISTLEHFHVTAQICTCEAGIFWNQHDVIGFRRRHYRKRRVRWISGKTLRVPGVPVLFLPFSASSRDRLKQNNYHYVPSLNRHRENI